MTRGEAAEKVAGRNSEIKATKDKDIWYNDSIGRKAEIPYVVFYTTIKF
jgi:hypothetical protein